MTGVEKPPLSARASCGATSSLVNVTVEPTARVTGLGENAVVVRPKAPLTMLMVVALGAGGAGVVAAAFEGAVFELLHAARLKPAMRINAYRMDMPGVAAKPLPAGLCDFRPESDQEMTKRFREPEWLSGRVSA